ncbi:uncharacterized protein LOC132711790 [Pantherophis guttatus]|uniref:Uncharacterized protein LOC132711790 n=1 Tax=Pantherophis guttatus TaxID=94885 RepID=A0ABM3ZGL6_PANGU|nr:uncharacterized protein LOC132711790 [Pantherophis guttatus]
MKVLPRKAACSESAQDPHFSLQLRRFSFMTLAGKEPPAFISSQLSPPSLKGRESRLKSNTDAASTEFRWSRKQPAFIREETFEGGQRTKAGNLGIKGGQPPLKTRGDKRREQVSGMLLLLCIQNEIAANPDWLQGEELRRSREKPFPRSFEPRRRNQGIPGFLVDGGDEARKARGGAAGIEGRKEGEEKAARRSGKPRSRPKRARHSSEGGKRRPAAPTCARTKRRRPPSQPSRRKTRGRRGWVEGLLPVELRAERRP